MWIINKFKFKTKNIKINRILKSVKKTIKKYKAKQKKIKPIYNNIKINDKFLDFDFFNF